MDAAEFIEKIVENEVDLVRRSLAERPSLAAVRDAHLGSTPLHFSAHRGFREIVAALLEAGADVHAREEVSGTTPLHWAAEGGHPAIARTFVERGADLEAADDWYGLSPLGWSTVVRWAPHFHEDRPATTQYLLEAGARMDLFTALVLSRSEAARELVARDPRALSRRLGFVCWGMDPLCFAAWRRLPEMASLLLDLGAEPGARTDWGLTALALALRNQDAATADLLGRRGAIEDLSSALIRGDLAAMAARLRERPLGGPGSEADPRGRLILVAAEEGNAEAVALLLAHGADADARARHLLGEVPGPVTPLHLAAMRGRAAAAGVLLRHGARPSPGAGDGAPTPLHLAAGEGHLETVRVLLEHGADAGAREKGFGATPLGWAEHGGHQDVARLLREPGGPRGPGISQISTDL